VYQGHARAHLVIFRKVKVMMMTGSGINDLRNYGNRWNKADLEYLKVNYPTKAAWEIAAHLKRTLSGINSKVNILGLKKRPIRNRKQLDEG
jgi:hypothetical protein